MNINRRNFLFGSAAAATLAGCATNKVGLRPLAAGELRKNQKFDGTADEETISLDEN